MAINWQTRTADTIADLRTFAGASGKASQMRVLGHTAAFEGGGGVFMWRTGTVPADDGGINITVPGVTSGWWQRNFVGCIYPRFFGAKGTSTYETAASNDDSAAISQALTVAATLGLEVDGEGKWYRAAGIILPAGTKLKKCKFRTMTGTFTVKMGEIGMAPLVYQRVLELTDLVFRGSCTIPMIITNVTSVKLRDITFTQCSVTSDTMYLSNIYDGEIAVIEITACTTTSATGAGIRMDGGVNGMVMGGIYTSAFMPYGMYIIGNASTIVQNPVIQGATTGIYLTSASGMHIHNPYFENVVNPLVLTNERSEVNNLLVTGGHWGGPYPTHPGLAENNGAMIRYYGSLPGVTVIGGKFDVSTTSAKALAVVGGSATLRIVNPTLTSNTATPEIRDFVFRESTALSTAGYHLEYVRTGNAMTIVRRTGGIFNEHIVEYFDAGANPVKVLWSPQILGNPPIADDPYINKIDTSTTVKQASYTLTSKDGLIRFNTTSGNLIASLPVANITKGKTYSIMRYAGSNSLTVQAVGGSSIINGATSFSISAIGDVAHFMWDGTAYVLVNLKSASGISSVGLTMPSIFSVTNSPLTANGSIVASLTTQTGHTVFAGPNSGGSAVPTFRALVPADLGSGTPTATNTLRGDGSWGPLPVMRQLVHFSGDQTNGATLMSYTVAGSLLSTTGTGLSAIYGGFFSGAATTHTVGIRIGGNDFARSNGTTAGGLWSISADVTIVTDTTVRLVVRMIFDNTGVADNITYTSAGEFTVPSIATNGLPILLTVAVPLTNVTATMGRVIIIPVP